MEVRLFSFNAVFVDLLVAVFLLDADRIDRATVDEGEEPGTRFSPSRIEAGRRSPDVEECLLNGILRESAVPENSNPRLP
jgi:hypothetical protein